MAASGALSSHTRLAPLDGLRGIAVLLVLWYHVWEISWLPAPARWLQFVPETGFIGVHLFFFLSGFVISYPFVQALVRGESAPPWGHFAWRRFIKIVPSYVLSIAVALAIGYAQTQSTTPGLEAILSHLLFIHTWFPSTYGSINGVLWTLAVEVEFYLFFPLVWWCFARAPWLTGGAMIGVAVAWRYALAGCCYHTLFPSYSENLPGYLDIFACGMLCALVYCRYGAIARERAEHFAPLLLLAGITATIALLLGLYGFRTHDQWQAVWQMGRRQWFGVAFAAIALGALCSPRFVQRLLANPLLVFFGAVSYNLYLYHQMIARELLWHRIPFYTGDPHADAHWQVTYTIVAVVVSIAEAALVTYIIERPLLRAPDPPSLGALLQTWGNAVRR
ncbi:MAG: acyltransferase family protein [Candidatus Tyrphobacter sp.]